MPLGLILALPHATLFNMKVIQIPRGKFGKQNQKILKVSDTYAPVPKRKSTNNDDPWLTPELKRKLFERDKMKILRPKIRQVKIG